MCGTTGEAALKGGASRTGAWRVRVVAGVVVGLLAVAGVWWFATVHSGMDLSGTSKVTLCLQRPTTGDRDLVLGNVTFKVPRRVTLVSVNLVDAQNLTLADALVAPTLSEPGGGETIPGLTRGWPLSAADRAQYTLDWTAERPLAGADLSPGQEWAPILHIHVIDSSKDASFGAWQVVYRMSGTRWRSTFTHTLRTPAPGAPCTA